MSFASWLLVVPAVLIATIGLAELAARYWLRMRGKYYVWAPYYRHELELDPGVFPNFPSPARFIVNSQGERGCEVPRNCEKLYRVLVAGGSAPECYALDQEATWPMLLQRILERPENLKTLRASHVHVGNIGRSGIGAEGLEFILRMVLRRIARLDTLIIMVGATDVFHWLKAGALRTPVREITPTTNMSNYFGWHPAGPFSWRLRRTALAQIVRLLRQLVLRPTRRSVDSGKGLLRARKMRANALEVRTEVQNPQVVADNFESYLRRAVRVAKAKADRVIVARQPWLSKSEASGQGWEHLWHGAVGDPFREEVRVFYSTEVLCQLMAQIDERAARVAQELGVEFCEFASAIEPSFNSYYDLIHFTPSGAAIVTKILASVILRESYSLPDLAPSPALQSARS